MNPPHTCSEKSVHYCFVIDSTNGLLLAMDLCTRTLFVRNPMAREYVCFLLWTRIVVSVGTYLGSE